jgi:diaminopimelate epimerase
MKFEKWQGLGNDFILTEHEVTPEQAISLCDRRLGIGGDGVLVIDREAKRMIVLNADGSRPEMCGNGLRCVAGWLAEHDLISTSVTVQTDAGERSCEIRRAAPGRYDVRVDMGVARITGELVHARRKFVLVDVGNPHAVCFEELDAGEAEELGPAVEAHVEGGVNVELVSPRTPSGFDVQVFERGVGWTNACGTGACAVVMAAVNEGLCERDVVVPIHLPGGALAIEVSADGVFMRGPAVRVFVGLAAPEDPL